MDDKNVVCGSMVPTRWDQTVSGLRELRDSDSSRIRYHEQMQQETLSLEVLYIMSGTMSVSVHHRHRQLSMS
jgi:hypothetical protein